MERIITIEVPEASFKAIEEPFEKGDYPTTIGVNMEVGRVVSALKAHELVEEGDDITVNLRGSKDISADQKTRKGSVETIFRENDDGTGAIDSYSTDFEIELADERAN